MLITKATVAEALQLAPTMRKADRDEVLASGGYTSAAHVLVDSLNVSSHCWAVRCGGELVALFGVVTREGAEWGVIWALTGEAADRHRLAALRASRVALAMCLDVCPRLVNFIDARHRVAIAWARWLGARFGDAMPYGVSRLPFYPVMWEARHVRTSDSNHPGPGGGEHRQQHRRRRDGGDGAAGGGHVRGAAGEAE